MLRGRWIWRGLYVGWTLLLLEDGIVAQALAFALCTVATGGLALVTLDIWCQSADFQAFLVERLLLSLVPKRVRGALKLPTCALHFGCCTSRLPLSDRYIATQHTHLYSSLPTCEAACLGPSLDFLLVAPA